MALIIVKMHHEEAYELYHNRKSSFLRYEVNTGVTFSLTKPINITIEREFVPPSLGSFSP